ncbi:hypothetical protein BN1423_930015 [Carnobacterium maltaromaticum]|nr:hypothetical protein BN1423_930015 [Carnobacterium maltaromaticum]
MAIATIRGDDASKFSKLGLIHLLSISGVHVQYLVTVFRRLFRRFKLSKELTDEALLLMLPLYGALAGGQTRFLEQLVCGGYLF